MTFKEFKERLLAKNPIHVNRNTQGCDWYFDDLCICHNRTHFPHNVFKDIIDSFWANTIYTSIKEVKRDASQFDGEVKKEFYCDEENPSWFIIFRDFDKVCEYMFWYMNRKNMLTSYTDCFTI